MVKWTLIKNGILYNPKYLGSKDILIRNDRIFQIEDNIENKDYEVIDVEGKYVVPLFVDGHEHILNESVYSPCDILNAGIGTIVGVTCGEMGGEFIKRNIDLTNELRKHGITSYALTGGFIYPCNSFYESINEDMGYFDEIVGVKTALNSKTLIRKGNPTYDEFKDIAYRVKYMSIQSSKALQIHVHLERQDGENMNNLDFIDKIYSEVQVPYSMYKLTHAQKYGGEILEYANKGCYLDYTAFDGEYDSRFDVLIDAIKNNSIPLDKISISSDAFGILRRVEGKVVFGKPTSLLNTFRCLVLEKGLSIEQVLPLFTVNAGALVKLHDGMIELGDRCKLMILNKDLTIYKIINY